jgi:hypothetical protein
MGHRENLTEGKEYQIMNIYREYGADQMKLDRKLKLNKFNKTC